MFSFEFPASEFRTKRVFVGVLLHGGAPARRFQKGDQSGDLTPLLVAAFAIFWRHATKMSTLCQLSMCFIVHVCEKVSRFIVPCVHLVGIPLWGMRLMEMRFWRHG